MEGESEATKADARQFMSDVLPTSNASSAAVDVDGIADGHGPQCDMRSWKSTYATAITAAAAEKNNNDAADATAGDAAAKELMETFWTTYYNPKTTSIWTMVYDEADSITDLDEAIGIVATFMTSPGMILEQEDGDKDTKKKANMKEHCFGVMHTCDNLDIKGLWFFNGPDPEELFGANADTSWYTWAQLGPEANEQVKNAVAKYLTPEKRIDNKLIKNTKVFC